MNRARQSPHSTDTQTHTRSIGRVRMCVIRGSTLLFVLNKLFGRTGGGILVSRLLHSHAATATAAAAATTWNRLRFTLLPLCLRQNYLQSTAHTAYTDPKNMCAFYCAFHCVYCATFFSPSNFAFFIRSRSTVCVCVSMDRVFTRTLLGGHIPCGCGTEKSEHTNADTHTYVRTCDARKHFPSECVPYNILVTHVSGRLNTIRFVCLNASWFWTVEMFGLENHFECTEFTNKYIFHSGLFFSTQIFRRQQCECDCVCVCEKRFSISKKKISHQNEQFNWHSIS